MKGAALEQSDDARGAPLGILPAVRPLSALPMTHGVPGTLSPANEARASLAPVQTIAVAGGKGGTGKSSVTVNLAAALGASGHEVLLLDGDLALGNIGRLLDLEPSHDLSHVMIGERRLEEVLLRGPRGVTVIPGANGVVEMANLSRIEHAGLIGLFSDLDVAADTLLIDLASGLPDSVLAFSQAVREVIVVVCDEPAALQDACATIRVLHERCRVRRFRIVANRVESSRHGLDLYAALTRHAERHLDVLLDFCGSIPFDPQLCEAVRQRRTVIESFPRSPAALAFRKLATRVTRWPRPAEPCGHVEFFVERLGRSAAPQR